MKKQLLICMLALISWSLKSQNGVTTYTVSSSLGSVKNCLTIDNNGNKWIGTNNGLGKFDGTTWTVYNTSNSGLPNNVINSVAFDNTNTMWVGTRAGLAKYNGSAWTTYTIGNSGIPNDTINYVFTKNADVWVCTFNGIGKLSNNVWTNYNTSNSPLPTRKITCLNIDANNDVFIGTSQGLLKKSGNNWTNYATVNPYYTAYFNIITIFIDNNNDVFVGTLGNGALKLIGLNLISLNSLYYEYGYKSEVPQVYSIIKGISGGFLFYNVVNYSPTLTQLANNQVSNYSIGIFGNRYLAKENNTGIYWGISYVSNILLSFNPQNYVGNTAPSIPVNNKKLDINNVSASILANSDMWWDVYGTQNAGYEVPKNSGRNAQFTSSLWIGGYDNANQLHLATQTYRQSGMDFWPGPLDSIAGTIDSTTSAQYDKVWKVDKLKVDEFRIMFASGAVQTGNYTPQNDIVTWPAHGTGNYSRNLAPFVDVNNDGLYRPLIDGDYPKIKGDQMCYWIFNDNYRQHTESGKPALKIEVHASAYAYYCPNIVDSLNVINYTTFYNYKVINRSNQNYHNTHLAFWDDADLGFFLDDYIGCNPNKNYAMMYNGGTTDGSGQPTAYGIKPPINSVVVLNGPQAAPNDGIDNNNNGTIDEAGEKNLMTSFVYFNNNSSPINGNPSPANENYMQYITGYWGDSTHITYGGNGYGGTIPTNFMYSGALDNATSWSEINNMSNQPNDRRFIMGCGPFNFNAGETVEYEIADVFTRDTVSAYSIGNTYNKNLQDVMRIQRWYANNNFPSCLTLSVDEKNGNDNSIITIYPNPTTGQFQVSSLKYKINAIHIYNLLGECVMAISSPLGSSGGAFDLSAHSKGIYFIRIEDENKNVSTKKVVVQ